MRLTFIVNNAAFFVSHRLPIARAMQAAGHEVSLITGEAGSPLLEEAAVAELERAGIAHSRLPFGSQSINPLTEAPGLLGLIGCLRRNPPDLVHCASPKGVLYGGIAARICRVPAVVFALTGMGYVFTGTADASWPRRGLAGLFSLAARYAFRHPRKRIIVQNADDWALAQDRNYASRDELRLIPGSGVDLARYPEVRADTKQNIVVFPARMLRDKGVVEFVEAARLIGSQAPDWRFVLAGTADYRNPSNVAPDEIRQWQDEGVVDWLGHVEDMPALFASASIACLPSYREGMPKALIEAAAAGCAVVTTDTVGCREVIIPGETGDLVPLRDPAALAAALLTLIKDSDRRNRYGTAGRQLAVTRFGLESVIKKTQEIYTELAGPKGANEDE